MPILKLRIHISLDSISCENFVHHPIEIEVFRGRIQREHETGIYERWAYVCGLDEGHGLFLGVTGCSLVETYESIAEPPASDLGRRSSPTFFFSLTKLHCVIHG